MAVAVPPRTRPAAPPTGSSPCPTLDPRGRGAVATISATFPRNVD